MQAIIGHWNYTEEFDFGTCQGVVTISQLEDKLIANFTLTERDNQGSELRVSEKCTLLLEDNTIDFKSETVECQGLLDGEEYFANHRQGNYTHEDKIVGHTWDDENACGVFVMTRIEK